MWRRTFLKYLALSSAAPLACSRKPEMPTTIESMTEREHLVFIGSRFAPGTNSPYAFNATGSIVGFLGKVDQPYVRAVSLDGDWIAWIPVGDWMVSSGIERPTVRFMSNPCCVQPLRLDVYRVSNIAISSDPRYLAIVVTEGSVNQQILVLHPETGQVEQELTELVQRFSPIQIERLGISLDGRVLTVGSREAFIVIDVPSRKHLLHSEGRFPSLSPKGDAVASVDAKGNLTVTDLVGGRSRRLMNASWTTYGVGAWSPDGQFILAGLRAALGFFIYLAAVHSTTGEVAKIKRLDEGDFGQHCAWINRTLLSS